MILKSRIDSDFKKAFKTNDRFVCGVLRGLKAEILNSEIALKLRDQGLSDIQVEILIQKEVKKRHETAKIYQEAARQELADVEIKEATVMEVYLPEPMSDEELMTVVKQVITESTTDLNRSTAGRVVGEVKQKVGSLADGSRIFEIINTLIKNKEL